MPATIFCAIDKADYQEALDIARRTVPYTQALKLGLTFFNKNGPQGIVEIMREINAERASDLPAKLFLDLKLHDIPMQVAGAVRGVVGLGAEYLTIHTSGGEEMMREAVKAAKDEADALNVKPPKLLGITVLTSLDEQALSDIGQGNNPSEQVLRLARLAQNAGLDGVVCSPQEVQMLRAELGAEFTLMVPGVRPAGADIGDQKRVMTPERAVQNGATHLVIGRPITGADDPSAVVQYIQTRLGQIA